MRKLYTFRLPWRIAIVYALDEQEARTLLSMDKDYAQFKDAPCGEVAISVCVFQSQLLNG